MRDLLHDNRFAPRSQQRSLRRFGNGATALDAQDSSLLGDIGSASLSGLGMIGNVLDLPGSSVRDVLALENPFDQWLSPLSGENRMSGRDLNRRWGLAGDEDTYANWWGGFVTELATDPLTYLGAGVNQAGKVAQMAGLADDAVKVAGKAVGRRVGRMTTTLDDAIRAGGAGAQNAADVAARKLGTTAAALGSEPLGTLGRFGIPFTEIGVNFGRGKAAERVAGWLDAPGLYATKPSAIMEKLGTSPAAQTVAQVATLPGRLATAAFDASAMGAVSEVGQDANRLRYRARQLAERQVLKDTADAMEELDGLRSSWRSIYGPQIEADAAQQLTRTVAGVPVVTPHTKPKIDAAASKMVDEKFERFFKLSREIADVDEALRVMGLNPGALPTPVRSSMTSLAVKMRKLNDDSYSTYRQMGGAGGVLQDIAESGGLPGFEHAERYARRRKTGLPEIARSFGARPGSSLSRDPVVRNVPSEIIEQMLVDDVVRGNVKLPAPTGGTNIAQQVQYVVSKWGKFLGKGSTTDPLTGAVIPDWPDAESHAKSLIRWAAQHRPETLYLNDNAQTFFRYQRSVQLATANLDAMHEVLKDVIMNRPPANLTGFVDDMGKSPIVYVKDLFKDAGLDVDRAANYLGGKIGMSPDDLKDAAVPFEIAQTIIAAHKPLNMPEWAQSILGVVDIANSWFKQAVTLPFPSHAGRNLGSGQYMNAVSGLLQTGSDIAAYAREVNEWGQRWAKGISRDDERRWLVHRVISPDTLFEDVAHPAAEFGSMNLENPLRVGQSWQQAGEQIEPSMLDRVPGLRTARQGYGAVLNTGAKANRMVEFLNRVPMFEYLVKKGWDPDAAAAKVREIQIDYSGANFAPFENSVMKRLVPFYSFQRKIAPVLLKTLAEQPGGALAQTVRASNLASSADASTPDYVSETMSIPNPFDTSEDGSKSYWAGFGLPFEQHAQYIGGPRQMGRELLSQITPLAKAPLEWATNQSFFQRGPGGAGRPLDELDPTVGRTLSNLLGFQDPVPTPRGAEFLASNSPATRFLTTARQLSDPRKSIMDKALNTFTGVRVTDVSPAAQDAVLRERSRQMMDDLGAADFTKTYFRPEDLAAMSPQQRDYAERLTRLQTVLAERAKARKEEKLKKAGIPAR